MRLWASASLLIALLHSIPEVFNMSSVIETETLPDVVVEPLTRGRGPVMAIGGAEDKFRERIILSTFVQLAGGKDACIAVVPTASSIESAGERYKAIFMEMGAS